MSGRRGENMRRDPIRVDPPTTTFGDRRDSKQWGRRELGVWARQAREKMGFQAKYCRRCNRPVCLECKWDGKKRGGKENGRAVEQVNRKGSG